MQEQYDIPPNAECAQNGCFHSANKQIFWTLSYPAVSCRILPYPAVSAVSCRILPYPAVSCRILPYPAVSCRILPYPAVSCRIVPYPAVLNTPNRETPMS